MPVWETLLVAVVGGLALVATALFSGLRKMLLAWIARKTRSIKRGRYIQGIQRLGDYLEFLEKIKKIRAVQRCVIYRGQNCGGVPAPGKPYTVKAIGGWVNKEDKEDPVAKYDFDLRLDIYGVRMIEEVIRTGVSIQKFDKIPEDAQMRGLYEIEGVQYAEMHYLGLVDDQLIFLSAGSFDATEFDKRTSLGLRFLAEKLRAIVESHDE